MKLFLSLTFKGSLSKWNREGVLSREMALYVEHLRQNNFDEIFVFTYDKNDASILDLIECPAELRSRISLVLPRRQIKGGLGALIHSLDIPLLWRTAKKGIAIAKTNQINGGWVALLLRFVGVPLFTRCGYLLSRRSKKNGQPARAAAAATLEAALFAFSRLITVSTVDARDIVLKFPFVKKRAVFVTPTYVDLDVFEADFAAKHVEDEIIFVGRLEPQKNVMAIVDGCRMAGIALRIIGDGSLRDRVRSYAAATGARVSITPHMQNRDIAELYRSHRYFILASLHEGLPKALIEALAAQMIAIGTPISGITDLIEDGRTGYLTHGTDARAIAAAIARARDDAALHPSIAAAARNKVLATHSLPAYAKHEGELVLACLEV